MTSNTPVFAEIFEELTSASGLAPSRVREVFDSIFDGKWTPAQIGGLLVALRMKGETAETLAAAAAAMRAVMLRVDHGLPLVLDTCGTGGDRSSSLNLSTGAAVIAAAAGVPVAKHGNRAATSRAGSADVLEALEIPLNVPVSGQATVLKTAGITFLFAIAHHPAMRHAMPTRRELQIRTLFNCLGPLANPAGATHQLIGAADNATRALMSQALRELGTERAWVVRSADGLDEFSPSAPTHVTQVSGGQVEELTLAPEDFGLERQDRSSIQGGDTAFNAAALSRVLRGEPHPARTAFILNAAAALVVAKGLTPKAAADLAQEVTTSGAAFQKLEAWRDVARAAVNA
ncbi:MAG TPA: anthranilate phosphoribosyltransferase [Polyangiaceae bacterium]|nr:anthranilate phosphoribosyltransferase [Polyangiaceae bacterium]